MEAKKKRIFHTKYADQTPADCFVGGKTKVSQQLLRPKFPKVCGESRRIRDSLLEAFWPVEGDRAQKAAKFQLQIHLSIDKNAGNGMIIFNEIFSRSN